MLPVGPLMVEHRLIERMISLIRRNAEAVASGQVPDTEFVRAAVDFIKTYADRLHHGKEEDILFRDLRKKSLSPEHAKIMNELIQEHAIGRERTARLVAARDRYLKGDARAGQDIAAQMNFLAGFYPRHIEKEDKHFFLPVMEYFTRDEQAAMLAEFNAFDRGFIHQTYRTIVAGFEK